MKLRNSSVGLLIFVCLFAQIVAAGTLPAVGSLFTYEGVLTNTSGAAISTPQNMTLQILLGACVLYEETQNISPGLQGEFSVIVGAGTRTDTTGNTSDRIFASGGTAKCLDGSLANLTGFATRSLRIKVGATELSPDITIGNIPFAINAQKLADKGPGDFVQVSAHVSQSILEDFFSSLTFSNLMAGTLNVSTAGTAGNVTGVVSVENGGTGKTSAAEALKVLLPPQSGQAGMYLKTDGVNVSWSAVNAATDANLGNTIVQRDLSGNFSAGTITANLSGNATNVTGIVEVGHGGTGTNYLAPNGVMLGSGMAPVQTVGPGPSGNVLTSDGFTWASMPLPTTGGRTVCPAGFTLIGTPGSAEAFCISTVRESNSSWLGAVQACQSKTPINARLCSVGEWVMACAANQIGDMKIVGEWVANVDNNSGASVMGGIGYSGHNNFCDSIASAGVSITTYGSRCCFR